jgi:hypothetical protein
MLLSSYSGVLKPLRCTKRQVFRGRHRAIRSPRRLRVTRRQPWLISAPTAPVRTSDSPHKPSSTKTQPGVLAHLPLDEGHVQQVVVRPCDLHIPTSISARPVSCIWCPTTRQAQIHCPVPSRSMGRRGGGIHAAGSFQEQRRLKGRGSLARGVAGLTDSA